ncbi:nucleotidyltransferase family protein [Albidovulum sp.]|uniref:nucleotidyltransferase family protein n=1 Tax=Albidovulum sp. TaxID=1872424 RepID=UPI001D835EC2|nr:nucleotidyltransferase family protein [Paracoccaceae bacterium]MCC0046429.1 nucleotidyltransferase family protein [Defluviimonas sp.]HPE24507.1 nucleotidyltransferase family protein [Albidovulum sp.]MCB2131280.1 nucleotidyltransferase family protein [Paracoccaceae bacterium]MCB2140542.1 nucleotidyltransferase family protein [Paracoccaceae bacterium]
MSNVAILIPAAGSSSRMRGADKLMETVDGEPMLRRIARLSLAASPYVFVTLPEGGPHALPRKSVLTGLDVRQILVADAHEGMAASLRAGALAAGRRAVDGLMVVPADMPELTAPDLITVATIFEDEPETVLRATSSDYSPGHPVVFPLRLFTSLAILTGDRGAAKILDGEAARLLPLPGRHATTDLDSPEDWAEWRRARGKPAR